MKKLLNATMLTLLAVVLTTGSAQAAPDSDLEKTYISKIDELLPAMGVAKLVDRKDSQQTLERMCFEASAPGMEAKREALSRAIMSKVGTDTAKPARVWMLRKIEPLGREEVVAGLTGLLHDPDPQIRELARRGLQNNPVPGAAAALRAELAKAEDNDWAVALINALGFRRDEESVEALDRLAFDLDDAVARAAIAALAKIGNDAAVQRLAILPQLSRHSARASLRDDVIDACLRAAEHLADRGATDDAVSIYKPLCAASQSERIRIAALHGLVAAQGVKAAPQLVEVLNGGDERMQAVAARCAQDLQGPNVTRQLVAAFEGAQPAAQAILIEVLGRRGDPTALPTLVKHVENPDQQVRIAALTAVGLLGDSSAVPLLAGRASKTTGDERNAARASLVRLKAEGTNEAILGGLERTEGALRAELIRAAAARRVEAAVPLFQAAAEDADPAVQVAGISALGTFATEQDLAKLLGFLVAASSPDIRQAAEESVTRVCLGINDHESRAEPVVAALADASPKAKASLIRILGNVQGNRAAKAVSEQVNAGDETVRDAAVRAAAGWKHPSMIKTLRAVMEAKSTKADHRSLALRGYVRLVRALRDKAASDQFDMLKAAMPFARQTDDKKVVLGATRKAAGPEALSFVLPYLDQTDLRVEAGNAALDIALAIVGTHQQDAVAAIKRVIEVAPSNALRARADRALTEITSYCVSWLMSGPYTEEGKKGEQLFDVKFAPEEDGASAEWYPLEVTNPNKPGQFDLGVERDLCAYFKTSVWSDKQQKVRLEMGSDDGIKAWANGQLVHANNASRGINCSEDVVEVELEKGWTGLLIKIVQGGGGWGFCCSIRNLDRGRVEGLKFEAK